MNKRYLATIVIILFAFFLINPIIFGQEACDVNEEATSCEIDFNNPNLFDVNVINNTNMNPSNNELVDLDISEDIVCGVYFSGIGCPSCAKADPTVFEEYINDYNNFFIIEYEVYKKTNNAKLFLDFDNEFKIGNHIPLMLFDKDNVYHGHKDVINKTKEFLDNNTRNLCPLPSSVYNKGSVLLKDLDIGLLSENPTIWTKDKALVKNCTSIDSDKLSLQLLTTDNVDSVLENSEFNFIEEKFVEISGKKIYFDNAIQIHDCFFYWNGVTTLTGTDNNVTDSNSTTQTGCETPEKINIFKVMFLAIADAVNPCAFAVLLLMLMSIVVANPKSKKVILLSGLSFILSIFIMYFIYGLVLIKAFQFLAPIRIYIYNIIAIFALFLGVMEIKDFFWYKPGSLGTEMPLSLRPKMQKLVSKITSPIGAFVLGLFVTVFLLPCTIGPYVILGGMLSIGGILSSIPLLLLYNLIFILPMLAIVIIVYLGMRKIEDVAEWKQKYIRYLHLIAGIVIFLIGLSMLFGFL